MCVTLFYYLLNSIINRYSNMTAYISSTSICRCISTFSTCALNWKQQNNLNVSVMIKSLHGRFSEVIHNNYTLYYFVYMYAQICDENALIWGFPPRMFRPPPTWNVDDVNNQYSYSYVKGAKRNSRCVANSTVA